MSTDIDSNSRSKSHRSEEHRRETRHRGQQYDDDANDSEGRDRDRHRHRHRHRDDDASSRIRRRERDKRKDSKKRDRDDERREYNRSRRDIGSDSEDDDNNNNDISNISNTRSKSKHRDRRHSSRDKPSNKRRKKSSRTKSGKRSDDDSDDSSDYDRRRSNDKRKKKKKLSKSRQEKKDKMDKKSAKAPSTKTKKPDKSKLFPMGEPRGNPPDVRINAEEDYFSYHHEFWIYLFREEGTCFNDIETEESRAAFARFARQYNAGMLEEPYYSRTFPNEVVEESKTTKHSWGFKTTNAERKGLGDLQKGVRRQTEYNKNSRDQQANHDVRNINNIRSNRVSCAPVESLGSVRRHRPVPEERRNERKADRRLKEHVRIAQEELTGGPKDLRERKLEKKREHSARIHGAHRDHEGEAAGVELSDAALFGDDGNERGRNRQKKERRDEHQKNRIQELKAKEKERQNKMLKMLGLENLQGQKKLTIAPRK